MARPRRGAALAFGLRPRKRAPPRGNPRPSPRGIPAGPARQGIAAPCAKLLSCGMETIILASASPRRLDFFRLLELPFRSVPAGIDEAVEPGAGPREAAESLALRKALAAAGMLGWPAFAARAAGAGRSAGAGSAAPALPAAGGAPPAEGGAGGGDARWALGADTIVALGGEILGKPGGRDEAREMLRRLSGRRHEAVTGMALLDRLSGRADVRSASCEVEFARLEEGEIEWYLGTGEWQGAAGGYRLQERGACLAAFAKGSPSAAAGLPLREFCAMLRENGCRIWA